MKKSFVTLLVLCSFLFTFMPDAGTPTIPAAENNQEVQPASDIPVNDLELY